jgi:hypothetical protein
MELLIVLTALGLLAMTSFVAGADSRPRLDDEPHRAI